MNLEFSFADEQDTNLIFLAYYNYFLKMYGKPLATRTSQKAIVARNYDSKLASFLDDAYLSAANMVNNFLPNAGIMKVTEGGIPRGYFRISFMQKLNELSAHIGEIVIPNETLTMDMVDAYKAIVEAIEKELKDNIEGITRVSYEVIHTDEITANALNECGYGYAPVKGEGRFYTLLYEKSLLEEEIKKD